MAQLTNQVAEQKFSKAAQYWVVTMSQELPEDIVQEAINTIQRGDLGLAINLLEAGALSGPLQPHLAALLSGDPSQDYRVEVKARNGVQPKHALGYRMRELERSQQIGRNVAYQIHLFGTPKPRAIYNATKHYGLGTEMTRIHYEKFMKSIKYYRDKSNFLWRSFDNEYNFYLNMSDFMTYIAKKPPF